MTGIYYPIKSSLCFVVFGWDHFKKSLRCAAACCDPRQWLPYLVSNGSRNRHCFDTVYDQVRDNLLQLTLISGDEWQFGREIDTNRNPMIFKLTVK